MTAIDIGVCTFRREHITKTLCSLAALKLKPGWQVRVIVADNDEHPSAKDHIETAAKDYKLNLTYVHAPARNISIARNACLRTATAPYLAFIDDDEIVTSEWLITLMDKLDGSKADVVLGPVQALYAEHHPIWMKKGNFHATQPVWVNGKIITGYSCNVLMRWAGSKWQNLRFLEELGNSGGEDTVFFATAHKTGAVIEFAPNALAIEAVTDQRASRMWLLKRAFRSGQTHGYILLEKSREHHALHAFYVLRAALKADICFLVALSMFWYPKKFYFWLQRGTLHTGVVARLLGQKELKQYG
ncbi:MAG: glycosyltransferase family 2 protein [Alphaproteobacteria bacterium]